MLFVDYQCLFWLIRQESVKLFKIALFCVAKVPKFLEVTVSAAAKDAAAMVQNALYATNVVKEKEEESVTDFVFSSPFSPTSGSGLASDKS